MYNEKWLIISTIVSIMSALGYANLTKNADKEIRINFKFYPKHYMMPPHWLRKMFSLTKREMAKFLVLQLYFSIASIAIGTINAVLFLVNSSTSVNIARCLLMFQMCWGIVYTIVFLILFRKFKQRDRKH